MNIHRRIPEQLLTYWEEIKGDHNFPAEDDIVPAEIHDIWEDCFIVRIEERDGKKEYSYSYLGASIQKAYGDDLTGVSVRSIASPSADTLADIYEKIVETGKPAIDESQFRNLNNITVRYRQCLVPLAKNGKQIDAILGGMRYKMYPGA